MAKKKPPAAPDPGKSPKKKANRTPVSPMGNLLDFIVQQADQTPSAGGTPEPNPLLQAGQASKQTELRAELDALTAQHKQRETELTRRIDDLQAEARKATDSLKGAETRLAEQLATQKQQDAAYHSETETMTRRMAALQHDATGTSHELEQLQKMSSKEKTAWEEAEKKRHQHEAAFTKEIQDLK